MKNHPAGVSDPHEGGQLSPVSSPSVPLYLNSVTKRRKSRTLSQTHPGRWHLLLAHS